MGGSWRGEGEDPDYRFSLANERTFLAWVRTAIALLAGAVGIVQLATDLGSEWVRRTVGGVLAATGIVVAGLGVSALEGQRARHAQRAAAAVHARVGTDRRGAHCRFGDGAHPRRLRLTFSWVLQGSRASVSPGDAGGVDTQCVVVGAGAAGLAVSRRLADSGVAHLVLERRDVADTWRSQRWDSFTLNTPDWMNDGLRAGAEVSPCPGTKSSSVEQQAEGLPVRTQTPVTAVDSSPPGSNT